MLVAGLRQEEGLAVAAHLHRPQAGGKLGREMDLHGLAVGTGAVDLGGQGARRVEDDQVALVEEAGELGEVRMHQRAVALVGHQHPHGIAGHAPGLRRRGRLQLGGQGERQRAQGREGARTVQYGPFDHGIPERGHAVTSAPTSSAAR